MPQLWVFSVIDYRCKSGTAVQGMIIGFALLDGSNLSPWHHHCLCAINRCTLDSRSGSTRRSGRIWRCGVYVLDVVGTKHSAESILDLYSCHCWVRRAYGCVIWSRCLLMAMSTVGREVGCGWMGVLSSCRLRVANRYQGVVPIRAQEWRRRPLRIVDRYSTRCWDDLSVVFECVWFNQLT